MDTRNTEEDSSALMQPGGSRFEALDHLERPVCVVEDPTDEIVYFNDSFADALDVEDLESGRNKLSEVLESEHTAGVSEEDELSSFTTDELVVRGGSGPGGFTANKVEVDDEHVLLELEAGDGSGRGLAGHVVEILDAGSQEMVETLMLEAARDLHSEARLYRYDGGSLEGDGGEPVERDDPAWLAFTSNETKVTRIADSQGSITRSVEDTVFEGSREHGTESDEVPLSDYGSLRFDVPVDRRSILSVTVDGPGRQDYLRLKALVGVADEKTKGLSKSREVDDLNRRLRDVENRLEQGIQYNQLLRGAIRDVQSVDSREAICRSICERIAQVEGWEFAWLVEADDDLEISCVCDDLEVESPFAEQLERAYMEDTPTYRCLEDGELTVVDDVAMEEGSQWRRTVLNAGYLSVATAPVRHGKRGFGALEVYSEEPETFDEEAIEVLKEIAGLLGFAFVSAEQVQSVLSEDHQKLTLEFAPEDLDCYFSRLVRKLETEANLTSVAPQRDRTLVYFECDVGDADVLQASDEIGTPVEKSMKGFVAQVSQVSLVEEAMDVGGRVSRYSFEDGSVHVDVNLPRDVEANELLEIVQDSYPKAELAARRYSFDEFTPDDVINELTGRQETVLRLAYDEGFFEAPREKTGDEIADELDITATTFHQHLRAAEKTMVSNLLEDPGR